MGDKVSPRVLRARVAKGLAASRWCCAPPQKCLLATTLRTCYTKRGKRFDSERGNCVTPTHIVYYLVAAFVVVYVIVDVLVMRFRMRRYWPRPLPSIQADSKAWVAFWLPEVLLVEFLVLIQGFGASYFIVLTWTADGHPGLLWAGVGVGLAMLLFAVADGALVAWARAQRRRCPPPVA